MEKSSLPSGMLSTGIEMKREEILLEDGRYLIYYSFDDEVPTATSDAGDSTALSEPEPER